jgi:hypothetical protein
MSRSIIHLRSPFTSELEHDNVENIRRYPGSISVDSCSESSNESDKTICQLSDDNDSDSSDVSREDSDTEEHTIARSYFGQISFIDAMTYLFTEHDESESLDTFDESENRNLVSCSSSSGSNDSHSHESSRSESEGSESDRSSQQEVVSFYDEWLRRKGKEQFTGAMSSSDESCERSRIPADETSELTVEDSDDESDRSDSSREKPMNSFLDVWYRRRHDEALKSGRSSFPREIIIKERAF